MAKIFFKTDEAAAASTPSSGMRLQQNFRKECGHKAALTEIVETSAEKIHAEIEKKKKAARRGAPGY